MLPICLMSFLIYGYLMTKKKPPQMLYEKMRHCSNVNQNRLKQICFLQTYGFCDTLCRADVRLPSLPHNYFSHLISKPCCLECSVFFFFYFSAVSK
jgi:hypothetical protein